MKISTGELEAHTLAERRVILKTEAQASTKEEFEDTKGVSESINRRTDYTVANREKSKEQTTISRHTHTTKDSVRY